MGLRPTTIAIQYIIKEIYQGSNRESSLRERWDTCGQIGEDLTSAEEVAVGMTSVEKCEDEKI